MFAGRGLGIFFKSIYQVTVPSQWLWAVGASSKHLTVECESSCCYVTAVVMISSSRSGEFLRAVEGQVRM